MMSAPAGAGPPPVPDMSHVDPGLQPTLIALLYLFPGLALLVLLVRFWRKSVDHLLGGDDAIIALAWILSTGNSVITHLFCKTMYTGYRQEDVPFNAIDMIHAFKLQYALSIVYNPCICLVKASFLWSLYKLRSHNPWIKRTIIGLQVLNGVYMVATTIVSAVPCLPVAKSWDPSIPGGCYSPTLYVSGNVSVVIITDFLVMLIPTWIIWDLQMPLKRKLVTIAFLSLGFIVIAIGIARLLWLLDAFQGKTNSYSVTSAYSAIESSVAIIGTSGPTVKYILSFCIPWLRPSFERSTNKSSGNAYSYGNHSNIGTSRRSRKDGSGYDDLDSESVEQRSIEMKSDWRRSEDAQSDEQRIAPDHAGQHGIVKSMEWTVHTREDSRRASMIGIAVPLGGLGYVTPGGRPAEQPKDIV
ncbi:hypothetical protein HBI49_062290 [Parastagonospora nodorum]|nr:hypothetical protein HBI49_062290 [Parastagonospora nodorum]KAH5989610.1 hypothetical protein HBI84_185890 [Parastagonospora nodorum]KAH6132027.1 hypothetical protein HBI64_086120 [Parastagonospora nodorum]